MHERVAEVEGPDGTYRLAYTEWGDPSAAEVVICVHGLTRNGRDFDRLAADLATRARVICPDVVGRGASDRLADPSQYAVPTYAGHLLQLLSQLGLARVHWVGTSMGGLIGMAIAAGETSPIARLVLNDVGPLVPKAAVERIKTYLGLDLSFDDVDHVEAHLRTIHAPFGPLTDEQWRHLAVHSARPRSDGRLVLAYDPEIAHPVREAEVEDLEIWALYDQIRCPTLVLRGAESDLLLAETADEMTRRGPGAKLIEWPGIGHAPALMADDQIKAIRDWLFAEVG